MAPRTLALPLIGIGTTIWLIKSIRIVRVQGFWSSVCWTARSWLWSYPVIPDFSLWNEGDPNKMEQWRNQRNRILRIWHFLRPFFASKGYKLYVHSNPAIFCSTLIPQAGPPYLNRDEQVKYPFTRYCCENESQLEFLFVSQFVWPARNNSGREVVIKAVSGAAPTNELKAFQLLHSDSLRDDPRNHTIPILEYIEFNQQTFAVMPRWSLAMEGDFITVSELIRYGQAFFEAVAFLHENKIAHGDILLQNMFMDVIAPPYSIDYNLAGLRGPERRYAFIDFETAMLPPINGSSISPALENAFREDIYRLATQLEKHLRCIEDVIPQLGPLLDSMKDLDGPSQPSTAVALARYEEICKAMSEEDFARPVLATRWTDGVLRYRKGPPVYLAPMSTKLGDSES